MLGSPLEVRLSCSKESDERLVVSLDHVLVVDALPVPLHLSTRRIFVSGGLMNKYFAYLITGGYDDRRLAASLFPTQFHSHAYWNKNRSVMSFGINRALSSYLGQFVGKVREVHGYTKACGFCGASGTAKCTRCKRVRYCQCTTPPSEQCLSS